MDDWRVWAKAGVWSRVDSDRVLMERNPEELADLRDVLRLVVPVLPPEESGTSLLTPERLAVPSDKAFLRKHVEEGNYSQAMLQLQSMLAPVQDARLERHVRQVQHRLEERAGSEFEMHVCELGHAAAHLEEIDLYEPELEKPRLTTEQWSEWIVPL